MTIKKSEYIDIANKISNAKNDNWLLELQGLIEYQLHKIKDDKELDSVSRHLYLFEYKGVKITGHSRDEVALLRGQLKSQIDLRIANEQIKDTLWEYIQEGDIEEIKERIKDI